MLGCYNWGRDIRTHISDDPLSAQFSSCRPFVLSQGKSIRRGERPCRPDGNDVESNRSAKQPPADQKQRADKSQGAGPARQELHAGFGQMMGERPDSGAIRILAMLRDGIMPWRRPGAVMSGVAILWWRKQIDHHHSRCDARIATADHDNLRPGKDKPLSPPGRVRFNSGNGPTHRRCVPVRENHPSACNSHRTDCGRQC